MTENTTTKQRKFSALLKNPGLIFVFALIILVVFDQLIWDKQPGLQMLLITLLVLTGLFILALLANKRIPRSSHLLLIPILFGAIMTVVLIDGQTRALNLLLVQTSLFLLLISLLNGQWLKYRVREVFMGGLYLLQSMFVDPALLLIEMLKSSTAKQEDGSNRKRRFPPVLLGIIIAIPILGIFNTAI